MPESKRHIINAGRGTYYDENILEKDFAMMQAADYSSVIMLRSSQSMSLS